MGQSGVIYILTNPFFLNMKNAGLNVDMNNFCK